MIYVSSKRLRELKEELEKRKTILRQKIAERIQEAQIQGDVSESAEYAEAKEEQAFNEGRIVELGNIINNAILLSKKQGESTIQVGSQIIVKDKKGKRAEFTIVGPEDAEPTEGKISNESPLGRALLDKKKGDQVEVETPKGKKKYRIVKIK